MTEEQPKPSATEVVSPDKAPLKNPPAITDDTPLEGSAITPFEGDFMEITINVAKHLEEYGKAVDAIMNFIIKRTYPGDWVSHDRASTPANERTVNMTGAAAERIARDLGIQESERTQAIRIAEEKHPGHYRYECEGTFTFRGRSVKAKGIATTLNPFYSKKGDSVRKPEDIHEEYIQRDAWRDCTKQGVKGLFGLRKIPITKLKELGFDIGQVKFVNFKEGGQGGANDKEATANKADKEILTTSFTVKVLSPRMWNATPIIDLITDKGEKFSWFGKSLTGSEEGKHLEKYRRDEYRVTVQYHVKGNFKEIDAIVDAVAL